MITRLALCLSLAVGLGMPAWARADREEIAYPGLSQAQRGELYCIVREAADEWLADLEEDIYVRDQAKSLRDSFWYRIEDGIDLCADKHGWSTEAGEAAGLFTLLFLDFLVEEPDAVDYVGESATVIRKLWSDLPLADRQKLAGDEQTDVALRKHLLGTIKARFDTDESATSSVLDLFEALSRAELAQRTFAKVRGWK